MTAISTTNSSTPIKKMTSSLHVTSGAVCVAWREKATCMVRRVGKPPYGAARQGICKGWER
jgi:hypothetical protein